MFVYVVCLSRLLHTNEIKNAETAKVVKYNIYSPGDRAFSTLLRLCLDQSDGLLNRIITMRYTNIVCVIKVS